MAHKKVNYLIFVIFVVNVVQLFFHHPWICQPAASPEQFLINFISSQKLRSSFGSVARIYECWATKFDRKQNQMLCSIFMDVSMCPSVCVHVCQMLHRVLVPALRSNSLWRYIGILSSSPLNQLSNLTFTFLTFNFNFGATRHFIMSPS